MKKKEHIDYFDVEFKPKRFIGAWLGMLFLEGGWVLLLYLIYKIFN